MGTVLLTIAFTLAYLVVSLLCPFEKHSRKPAPCKVHTACHAGPASLEESWTALFIEAWLVGGEQWIRYAWVETWPETVSWGIDGT